MLLYAKPYEEKLRQLFYTTDFDPLYNYYSFVPYREIYKLPDNTWEGNHFVSIHNDIIIGLIGYSIRRMENAVNGLHIIHFPFETVKSPHSYIFGKDVMTAIKDIFEKFNFNKLNFTVAKGNPIEKSYDRLVKRYNGRIVGIREQDTKLMDGKLYDVKEYEILAVNYLRSKR